MTVSIEEAAGNLSSVIAKAEAGEEVYIARDGQPAVRLVPLLSGELRLEQHPELSKALIIRDHSALVKPLPPEDWNGWADR